MRQALGFIETYGYIAGVESADSCLKAANVQLIDCHFIGSGLVTIIIEGDVGAVKAAIDAGSVAAERVGQVVSINVIPRPGVGLESIIQAVKTPYYVIEGMTDDRVVKHEISEELMSKEEVSINKFVHFKGNKIPLTSLEPFKTMKVVELRKVARQIKEIEISKEKIKFSKKDELLKAIEKVITEVE